MENPGFEIYENDLNMMASVSMSTINILQRKCEKKTQHESEGSVPKWHSDITCPKWQPLDKDNWEGYNWKGVIDLLDILEGLRNKSTSFIKTL